MPLHKEYDLNRDLVDCVVHVDQQLLSGELECGVAENRESTCAIVKFGMIRRISAETGRGVINIRLAPATTA